MTHNQRVLALLRDGDWHSHHELYGLGVIAHSRVADLRKRGCFIEQRRDSGPNGAPLYLYRLVAEPSLTEPSPLTDGSVRDVALARPAHADDGAALPPSESEEEASHALFDLPNAVAAAAATRPAWA